MILFISSDHDIEERFILVLWMLNHIYVDFYNGCCRKWCRRFFLLGLLGEKCAMVNGSGISTIYTTQFTEERSNVSLEYKYYVENGSSLEVYQVNRNMEHMEHIMIRGNNSHKFNSWEEVATKTTLNTGDMVWSVTVVYRQSLFRIG